MNNKLTWNDTEEIGIVLYERYSDSCFQNRIIPYVDGKRFPDIPVYLLISPRTASAAEEFAYSLKRWNERYSLVKQLGVLLIPSKT